MSRLRFGVGLIAALMLAAAPHGQETQSVLPLEIIMSRAATYIETYASRFSGIVVEESYVQDVRQSNRFGFRQTIRGGPVHRTLKSDLLLVRLEGDVWMQFRDVFEVDGRAVRDRNDRLEKLFLQQSKSTAAQADKIVKESARYNIGDIERTVNLPVLGLTVLDRRMQPNFQFHLGTAPGELLPPLPASPVFVMPQDAVMVSFEEIGVRTMIATPQGKNLRARGRIWFALPRSEVLMTELRVEDFTLGAAIHVAYQLRDGIDVPVPVEMHELYENKLNGNKVDGAATYANFRKFNVKIDEDIVPPAAPPR